MPDRGHDGNGGGENFARHPLIVERPKVLERAAAPSHDDGLGPAVAIGASERARDGGWRLRALYRYRVQPHGCQWPAPAQHVQDIPDDGATRRGDDRYAARV